MQLNKLQTLHTKKYRIEVKDLPCPYWTFTRVLHQALVEAIHPTHSHNKVAPKLNSQKKILTISQTLIYTYKNSLTYLYTY